MPGVGSPEFSSNDTPQEHSKFNEAHISKDGPGNETLRKTPQGPTLGGKNVRITNADKENETLRKTLQDPTLGEKNVRMTNADKVDGTQSKTRQVPTPPGKNVPITKCDKVDEAMSAPPKKSNHIVTGHLGQSRNIPIKHADGVGSSANGTIASKRNANFTTLNQLCQQGNAKRAKVAGMTRDELGKIIDRTFLKNPQLLAHCVRGDKKGMMSQYILMGMVVNECGDKVDSQMVDMMILEKLNEAKLVYTNNANAYIAQHENAN